MHDLEWQLDEVRRRAKEEFDADHYAFVVEALTEFVALRPDDAYAWFLYGDALRTLGRSDEAEAALLRAFDCATGEERQFPAIRLGTLYEARGTVELADEWFERAIKLCAAAVPDWLWILKGANLSGHGRFDEALSCFEEAKQLNSKNSETYLNMVLVLRAMRKYAEAYTAVRFAYVLAPHDKEVNEALESLSNVAEGVQFAERLRAAARDAAQE